jgi:hypothetical protein
VWVLSKENERLISTGFGNEEDFVNKKATGIYLWRRREKM